MAALIAFFLLPSLAQSQEVTISDLGKYPGYEGPMIFGHATLAFDNEKGVAITYDLVGIDSACSVPDVVWANSCGIHIHEGTSCADTTGPGGHYYDQSAYSTDPWAKIDYEAPYISGTTASGHVSVKFGYTFAQSVGHVLVVHDRSGGRATCAEIPSDPDPPSAKGAQSGGQYTFFQGYCGGGNDIHVGYFRLPAAEKLCDSLAACKGFTLHNTTGVDNNLPVKVWFKGLIDANKAGDWRTYLKATPVTNCSFVSGMSLLNANLVKFSSVSQQRCCSNCIAFDASCQAWSYNASSGDCLIKKWGGSTRANLVSDKRMVMGWGAGTDCVQVAANECDQNGRCSAFGLQSDDGKTYKVSRLQVSQLLVN
jgi:hypothetical protein